MNYEQLKSAIRSVIRENGNEEITGDILQATLLAIVGSLGTGYQFLGVADAETEPGTPDQKVFYLRYGDAATLANFGDLSVPEALSVISWATSWTATSVMPKAGSPDFMLPVTWAELKALRDGGNLIPGMRYRITDYVTVTAQDWTQSALHPFDIIVTALSESVLSENASAIQHEGDTYFSSCNLAAWKLKYCLDNDAHRFAWALAGEMIVTSAGGSYSLGLGGQLKRYPDWDNTHDFPDYSEYEYAWGGAGDNDDADPTDFIFSKNEIVLPGEQVFIAASEELVTIESVLHGKGVIYYMKDEFNNECPYDFKNILFARKLVECKPASGLINDILTSIQDLAIAWNDFDDYPVFERVFMGLPDYEYSLYRYLYTFDGCQEADQHVDLSINPVIVTQYPGSVKENIIRPLYKNVAYDDVSYPTQYLNNIVFTSARPEATWLPEIKSNSFGVNTERGTIVYNGTIPTGTVGIAVGDSCSDFLFLDQVERISLKGDNQGILLLLCREVEIGSYSMNIGFVSSQIVVVGNGSQDIFFMSYDGEKCICSEGINFGPECTKIEFTPRIVDTPATVQVDSLAFGPGCSSINLDFESSSVNGIEFGAGVIGNRVGVMRIETQGEIFILPGTSFETQQQVGMDSPGVWGDLDSLVYNDINNY